MSKSKSTRSSKVKDDPDTPAKPKASTSASALRKIFYISQDMLEDGTQKLNLEQFYHAGKGKKALFMTKNDNIIMEVVEYSEPRRSWLINSEVCSNGHIYITTPIDVTFLALHHLRKHCSTRAISLDNIYDEEDSSVSRLLTNFIPHASLKCIADVKTAGGDNFYKYNHEKCLAWLSLKTKHVAEALKKAGIYCGHSAISQNYTRSENVVDETAHETDYLRMACDYIGGYISLELHEELAKYLQIPSEKATKNEEKKAAATNTKRKSGDKLKNEISKKQKLENGAAAKLKDSSLLEESPDDDEEENRNKNNSLSEEIIKSPKENLSTPLKEKTMTAKEKSLAKSAKGTKSIASFFMKKTAA
ncbi:ribonuclease H2 subunit B-like [Stomoxys calcitrans]|uniref:Ribonuclease H2 subunit B n=1 Tax=Stomoxys calcitrans TaxID=35570 RepID=A0A1I8Q8R7_STOCA|nr:ribonuclease H2 subunit B [Stomoxys calcitrans]XP_059226315.1 ribonuclease H2 subunit B-like [Stomoxys calcitrans]